MVINLSGPPGAGKSLFASKFVTHFPDWTYIPIDMYRLQNHHESIAWYYLEQDLISSKQAVLETSGLSWRLENIFKGLKDRPVFTMHFHAPRDVLRERVTNRQKRNVPNPYFADELEFIDYALEQDDLELIKCPDYILDTSTKSREDMYSACIEKITQFVAIHRHIRRNNGKY